MSMIYVVKNSFEYLLHFPLVENKGIMLMHNVERKKTICQYIYEVKTAEQ